MNHSSIKKGWGNVVPTHNQLQQFYINSDSVVITQCANGQHKCSKTIFFCFKHAVNCKIGVFLHLGLYDLKYQENPLYGHRAHTAVPVRTQPPSTCCSNILFVSISKLAFQRGACFRLCLEATSKAHYKINYYYMNSESCKATLVQSNNKQLR